MNRKESIKQVKRIIENQLDGRYFLGKFSKKGDTVWFELISLDDNGLSFDEMAKVAETFQTKKINVESHYECDCPTCDGYMKYTLNVIDPRIETTSEQQK